MRRSMPVSYTHLIDGVGRQCAEIDRQRRAGGRHDQAVAQTGQDRYIGIMGGVEEVDAKEMCIRDRNVTIHILQGVPIPLPREMYR